MIASLLAAGVSQPHFISVDGAREIVYSPAQSSFVARSYDSTEQKGYLNFISKDGLSLQKRLEQAGLTEMVGVDVDGWPLLTKYPKGFFAYGAKEQPPASYIDDLWGVSVRGEWGVCSTQYHLIVVKRVGDPFWEPYTLIAEASSESCYGVHGESGAVVVIENRFSNPVRVRMKKHGVARMVELELPLPKGSYMVPPENSLEFIDGDTVLFVTGQNADTGSQSSAACWLTVASLSRKTSKQVCKVFPPSGHQHPGWRNMIAIGPTMVAYGEANGYRFVPLEKIRKVLSGPG